MYELVKFVVTAHFVERDDQGRIVGEGSLPEPVVVYGVDKLREFADGFDAALAEASS